VPDAANPEPDPANPNINTAMTNNYTIIPHPPAIAPWRIFLRAGIAFSLLGAASVAWGAVSLTITKPPVTGGEGAGPLHDPDALRGQWFVPRDLQNPDPEPFVRTHEFYDNIPGHGGGHMGHFAIEGYVTIINGGNWNFGESITSFTVTATVTNDTHTWDGNWQSGNNSHTEDRQRQPEDPYVGPLIDSMLTIEFALADLTLQPAAWNPPYTQQLPEIIGINHDARAWYCFNEVADLNNPGNYFVPAWDFGTIEIDASMTRDLEFVVNGAIDSFDPRYDALVSGQDILMNRTRDLKIGDWVDVPEIDSAFPYPLPAARSGNASLFHIPEPSTVSLLGMVVLLALRRRR